MEKETVTHILLRVSVAFAFLYPPLSAIFHPLAWIGYFPKFILVYAPISEILVLHLFGILEVIIAFWILSGKRILLPSVLAAILLGVIVVFNFSQLDVVFRDISILFVAVTLAVWPSPVAATIYEKGE